MTIALRSYDEKDMAGVLDLSIRAWGPVFRKLQPAVPDYVYAAFYPRGWEDRQTTDITSILVEEKENVWVAYDGETLLGWVGIRLHQVDQVGEVYILAVDPDHQRRGVARLLLDKAFDLMRAADMKIVMVETGDDPGHAPSRATYEKAGFERWPVARYFQKL